MRAVRHHLAVLAGLIMLALFAGVTQSLWALAGLIVGLGTHRLATSLVMRRPDPSPGVLLAIVIISMALSLASAVVLFVAFGWVASTVFVLLWFVFWALREDKESRAWQQTRTVRSALVALIDQQESGAITAEQLTVRADDVLRKGFPGTRITTQIVTRLYDGNGLASAQHRRLVTLLNEWGDHEGPDEALRHALRDKR